MRCRSGCPLVEDRYNKADLETIMAMARLQGWKAQAEGRVRYYKYVAYNMPTDERWRDEVETSVDERVSTAEDMVREIDNSIARVLEEAPDHLLPYLRDLIL